MAFNDMLVDMCDALWRNKAFSNPTQGSLKALSAALTPVMYCLGISYPSSRFSIFQGQAFLAHAWKFFLKVRTFYLYSWVALVRLQPNRHGGLVAKASAS